MKIFFVGFMGCGKTTWGRKLANRLDFDFIDLDKVFEEHVGTTITAYFSEHGQDAFRLLEAKLLKETDYPDNVVVSTGGGLPAFFDNMDWMNANGETIYIKLSPAALAERLDKGKTTRPLIMDKHGEELVAFITEKLAERESYYEQATYTVNGIEMTPDLLANLVSHN